MGGKLGTVYTLAVMDRKSIIVPSIPIQLVDDVSKVQGNPFADEPTTGIEKSKSGVMDIDLPMGEMWRTWNFRAGRFNLQLCSPRPSASVSGDDLILVWTRQ